VSFLEHFSLGGNIPEQELPYYVHKTCNARYEVSCLSGDSDKTYLEIYRRCTFCEKINEKNFSQKAHSKSP
jgi:hypothetical protein